ncbi:MAG: hypothetical protein A3I00_05670 [Betaproteobacteria bacterium RIFCSPLOWO2_02_FULL_64_12]|nr:MAG: hypothetical protein A3I00_05670 [Betaproteobacteria bacterium RIFCSPLOWO2_02_FULL_64_12]
MDRVVGSMQRTEFVLDPAEAWRRGRELDRLLSAARSSRPRGVVRATHAELNRLDELRALEIARRINSR